MFSYVDIDSNDNNNDGPRSDRKWRERLPASLKRVVSFAPTRDVIGTKVVSLSDIVDSDRRHSFFQYRLSASTPFCLAADADTQ